MTTFTLYHNPRCSKSREALALLEARGVDVNVHRYLDAPLDIDALRVVANGINSLRSDDNATIVVTHYQRLLNYVVPDFVHVLMDGRIVRSGDQQLALDLEEQGYDHIVAQAA